MKQFKEARSICEAFKLLMIPLEDHERIVVNPDAIRYAFQDYFLTLSCLKNVATPKSFYKGLVQASEELLSTQDTGIIRAAIRNVQFKSNQRLQVALAERALCSENSPLAENVWRYCSLITDEQKKKLEGIS